MKKSKSFIIIFSVVLLIVIIGVSYAWLSSTIFGKKEYVLKAGELDLVLDESSNGLMIENEIPVTDEEGMASEGATFTVRNNGSSDICYQIYLDDSDLLEGEIRVEDKFVKYGIEKDNVIGSAKVLSEGRMIDETEIRAGVSVNYRLKLWFNIEEDGEIAGQIFRGKLRIEAIQCKSSLPIMKSYAENVIPTEDYHAEEYRTKITNVVTKNNTMIPDNVIEHWDVSEAGNNSVIAYIEDNNSGGYILTIGGNNGISMNSMSMLFSSFSNLISVDLSYFDTSRAKNMNYLFSECSNLQSVDVSMFDTSNCTSMAAMFRGCSSLQRIDVSNFDTKNLTLVHQMFRECTNLKSITFGQFDTSNVIYFHDMFYGCSELTVLDLTMFDTSKKIYMNTMFFNCTKLVNILVGPKWTIGDGSGTHQMFGNCGTDHVTVVSL